MQSEERQRRRNERDGQEIVRPSTEEGGGVGNWGGEHGAMGEREWAKTEERYFDKARELVQIGAEKRVKFHFGDRSGSNFKLSDSKL